MVSTRPQVRAHDEVFARAVVLRHYVGVVHQDGRRSTARRSHLVDFIAEPVPTPSGADGDEREAETHGAPKPPSSAAPPSKPVALSSYQADLRERVARDTNTLVARILADRLSRAFAVVYTRLTSIHKHFHRRLMTMSHTRRGTQQWVTEQSSMQSSLVVDVLAEMRNEDMLMEAGVSAVDPHAPWLLNEEDSLRVMDMAITYSRKLIADFIVFQRRLPWCVLVAAQRDR